jgi:alpha-amylase
LRKTITLDGGRMDGSLSVAVDVRNLGPATFDGTLQLEWNVNLSGGGGNPAAYYRWTGGESRHDAAGSAGAGIALSFGNEFEGVSVSATADPPAPAEWFPVETVSNSEAGFERVYQGSCLIFRWPLHVAVKGETRLSVRFDVTQTRDRLNEDR